MSPDSLSKPTSFRQSGAFDSVVAVALFVVFDRVAGLPFAIGAATLWSVKAAVVKHRRHERLGWLLPITTVYLVVRGVIGIVTDSRAVYFGISIATKYAIGLALIGSVLIGRGLLRTYAPKLFEFPLHVITDPIYISTMNRLTIGAGIYEFASATSDIWLYNNAPKGGYVLIRILVNWVSAFVAIFGAIIYADSRLKKIPNFPGLLALAEATLEGKHARS